MKLNVETGNVGTVHGFDPEFCSWNLSYLMGGEGGTIETVDIVEDPEPKEKPE